MWLLERPISHQVCACTAHLICWVISAEAEGVSVGGNPWRWFSCLIPLNYRLQRVNEARQKLVAVLQAVVKLCISADKKMAWKGSTHLCRPWWRSLEWPGRSLSRSDRWCQLGRGWSYAEDKWSIYGSQRRPWRNLACKLKKKTQNGSTRWTSTTIKSCITTGQIFCHF